MMRNVLDRQTSAIPQWTIAPDARVVGNTHRARVRGLAPVGRDVSARDERRIVPGPKLAARSPSASVAKGGEGGEVATRVALVSESP